MKEQTKEKMPNAVQYAAVQRDDDLVYWAMYDTVQDAVGAHGDGTQVYRAEFKPIGRYKRAVKILRIKTRKKKK
jgi:hypothetical protein